MQFLPNTSSSTSFCDEERTQKSPIDRPPNSPKTPPQDKYVQQQQQYPQVSPLVAKQKIAQVPDAKAYVIGNALVIIMVSL